MVPFSQSLYRPAGFFLIKETAKRSRTKAQMNSAGELI
jgi:hypothetical protein